ncbi:uncharacterized protein KGF55_005076 [Candida pseudojiufengensis]|uniref:uncharacterized protein n=1 Tax=Candida pseudojiufengensis TaxID=497109 RepID=UPI0022248352|nr:uncharacterized protein KGF55_005076 [Candida pseudojiufengensis]KAI5959844.1 hypothetical protein KGF55_005076 [Candida pseudojiufengensis]
MGSVDGDIVVDYPGLNSSDLSRSPTNLDAPPLVSPGSADSSFVSFAKIGSGDIVVLDSDRNRDVTPTIIPNQIDHLIERDGTMSSNASSDGFDSIGRKITVAAESIDVKYFDYQTPSSSSSDVTIRIIPTDDVYTGFPIDQADVFNQFVEPISNADEIIFDAPNELDTTNELIVHDNLVTADIAPAIGPNPFQSDIVRITSRSTSLSARLSVKRRTSSDEPEMIHKVYQHNNKVIQKLMYLKDDPALAVE